MCVERLRLLPFAGHVGILVGVLLPVDCLDSMLSSVPRAPVRYTIVKNWNAYQVPPDRHVPEPAGPVTNISTLQGCQDHCTASKGCVQFAWNYGAGAHAHPRRWYCEISSAPTWSGYPSDHIISGCLPHVQNCGHTPPPPPPVSPPSPTPWTPKWKAIVPNNTNSTWGYPLLAPDKVVHTYVYKAKSADCYATPTNAGCAGTYNHGPMVSYWGGQYWMEWYNGVKAEGVQNRVLYATSPDAVSWSAPAVMFNTTGRIGLENEPMVDIGGRRYSIAGSWDVNARKGGGAEHIGPDTPLMRRVHGPGHLGPAFWLGDAVPTGYEHLGYPTYHDNHALDTQTRTDASSYLDALLDAESSSDWGKPNERVAYELPGNPRRLITLLRSGGVVPGEPPVGSRMLSSSCLLHDPVHPTGAKLSPLHHEESYHVCRPGTGLWNVILPGDKMPEHNQFLSGPWPGYHPIPVRRRCNWTAQVVTSIPDSHSRACAAPLPDGRIFMIGAQIPRGRDPIALSISEDGLEWSKVWAVRNCVEQACKPRFGGPPGFQYPGAMWKLDGVRGPEIIFSYSINKEDIGLSRFPLSVLDE